MTKSTHHNQQPAPVLVLPRPYHHYTRCLFLMTASPTRLPTANNAPSSISKLCPCPRATEVETSMSLVPSLPFHDRAPPRYQNKPSRRAPEAAGTTNRVFDRGKSSPAGWLGLPFLLEDHDFETPEYASISPRLETFLIFGRSPIRGMVYGVVFVLEQTNAKNQAKPRRKEN